MARRTKDDAEKTRNSLIDAAEKVFYRRGVASSSLEDVARAAGVTRGAVYWHFRDKIELCEAMLDRVFLPEEDVLERLAAGDSDTPLEDLRKACIQSLTLLMTDRRRMRVFSILMYRCEYVDEMAGALRRRRDCKDRMLARFLRLFERAQRRKLLAAVWPPAIAAVSLQALLSGLAMGIMEGRKNIDFAKSGANCLNAFFAALGPEPQILPKPKK